MLPFTVTPQFRDYVWGGSRLRPGHTPTAEAWAVYETNTIADGEFTGLTLGELALKSGRDLLGTRVTQRIGNRFPILVKLLDCQQWLSLQVHPNDRQAVDMAGAGQFGKTEAWYFLDTDPDAEILCGLTPGVSHEQMASAVRNGSILDLTTRIRVAKGDYVLIPAGAIHALGPGLLVYEVQESSDITYRVFDWNRPASEGRALHIEPSIKVINTSLRMEVKASESDRQISPLISCDYFTLEKIIAEAQSISTRLNGESFHALTVIEGDAVVKGDNWSYHLTKYASLILPASCDEYTIEKQKGCELLRVTA